MLRALHHVQIRLILKPLVPSLRQGPVVLVLVVFKQVVGGLGKLSAVFGT